MKDKKILKEVLIICGFALIISGNVLIQELSNLDEIWIYNFGRCILNGLVPYRDFNIVITPLFPYICAFFLKIFGNEMIVLRFVEIFQIFAILFMIYKILKKMNVSENISIISALGIYILSAGEYKFDYNWMVLLITLIVFYMELFKQNNYKRDICLGILVRQYNSFKTNYRNSFINNIHRI